MIPRVLVLFLFLGFLGTASIGRSRQIKGEKLYTLEIVVQEPSGQPVSQAQVSRRGQELTPSKPGTFLYGFPGILRNNYDFLVTAAGYHPRLIIVTREEFLSSHNIHRVILTPRPAGEVTLAFVGDLMLSRRFYDRNGDGNFQDGLVEKANFRSQARALLGDVRDALTPWDFLAGNCETPIIEQDQPAAEKRYVFHTHPSFLDLLQADLGFDYVSLGNNHIMDHGPLGLHETLGHLRRVNLAFSGAGETNNCASAPALVSVGAYRLALVSFTTLGQSKGDPLCAGYAKAGAAFASRENLEKSLSQSATPGATLRIVSLHGGAEYRDTPYPSLCADKKRQAIELGADLVIAHHPHVLQGIECYQGKWIVHSLGNFLFEQKRLETFPSAMAVVYLGPGGITRLEMLPLWLEDWAPRLAAGPLATRIARRLQHLSRALGTTLAWRDGVLTTAPLLTMPATQSLQLPVVQGITDVHFLDQAFLSQVTASVSGDLQLGRDVLWVGDFEDGDVDDQSGEAHLWKYRSSLESLSRDKPHSGEFSLAHRQTPTSRRATDTVLGKLTLDPQKPYLLVGYVRAQEAGLAQIRAGFFRDRKASTPASVEQLLFQTQGNHDWQRFQASLACPDEAPLLKLSLQLHPNGKHSHVWWDDLVLLQFDTVPEPSFPLTIPYPNDYQAIRLQTKAAETVLLQLHFQVEGTR